MKFLLRFIHSFTVLAIHNKDQTLCASVVVSPEWSNFVLATDVPYIEFHVLVSNSFDIESNCERLLVLFSSLLGVEDKW